MISLEHIVLRIKQICYNIRHRDKKIIKHQGYYIIVSGNNGNNIQFGKHCYINFPEVIFGGKNNTLVIGDNCHIGPGCSFWLQGEGVSIVIGANSSFNNLVHFCAQEDNLQIVVGSDCMFSNNVVVRTSDSHPIFDSASGVRINSGGSVIIGDHVWVAPNSKILKGVVVGAGAVIASNAVVTKDVPGNSIVAGVPAKVTKVGIDWARK